MRYVEESLALGLRVKKGFGQMLINIKDLVIIKHGG